MKLLNRCLQVRPLSLLLLLSAILPATVLTQSAIAQTPQANANHFRTGEWNLIPYPHQGAPMQSRGGASRSSEWNLMPYPDQGAPMQSRGGASRGDDWNLIPYPDQGSPDYSRGGASRSDEWNLIPYPDQGVPEQSRGGAARRADWPQMMLTLMPEIGYGLTVSGHPTFFFYLPESNAQAGVFRLKNADGNIIYEQEIANPHQAGIVAIQLPETLPELAIAQTYNWYVVLQPEGEILPSSPFIDAGIQRVEASVAVQAAQASGDALAYAAALRAEGIWYDTIATLHTLRAAQPDSTELANHWQDLLTSADLDFVADVPVTSQTAMSDR